MSEVKGWHVYVLFSGCVPKGKDRVDTVVYHGNWDKAAKLDAQRDFLSKIEFYMGYPLGDRDGKAALRRGSFFVYDETPHAYWIILFVKEMKDV